MPVVRAGIAALGCAGALAVAAADSSANAAPSIVLKQSLPAVVRVGQQVTIAGRVLHHPRAAQVALEGQRFSQSWVELANATEAHGRFAIHWTVPKSEAIGPLSLRVVALRRGHIVAATATHQSGVGPAPVYCAPPVPPAVDIPVGDGWIVGGLYLEGGPYPGIMQCESQPYTIYAERSDGTVVASQSVAGGHSYTLVVPAGSYKLRSNGCGFGSATVTAAHETQADTVCPVP